MVLWNLLGNPMFHPIRTLVLLFLGWKAVLLTIVVLLPGIGYDTSTTLFQLPSNDSYSSNLESVHSISVFEKLTRWDSIYFLKIAERGYLFEQEWAFGWGYTHLISFIADALAWVGLNHSPQNIAAIGVALSHTCHLLSVLVLYVMSRSVFAGHGSKAESLSFISACLHVISPAGIFLSAPYTESLFSLLSFVAYALYIDSVRKHDAGFYTYRDLEVLAAAIIFAVSALVRSNGLLNGVILVYDALITARELFQTSFPVHAVRKLVVIGLGGLLMMLGGILPQYIAYMEYCNQGEDLRPWCYKTFPSIYTFVQSYYWNVGFLRYWRFSNLPLFALATPMLILLSESAIWALQDIITRPLLLINHSKAEMLLKFNATSHKALERLAIPQLILAIAAFTTYHVQIITRISSGYPLWYWWLALQVSEKAEGRKFAKFAVRWMVLYSLIQGGLFALFLPPA